ncbi:hypothetical protein GSI_11476 [Ganoderma sinense ZZ0214-1]|uniref:Uncharacterized protein n=1 Tax=Ganoderma sinense ZZ0214-1 TaxID=1077348 RepID=A0A2G8RW29_9APHY|nr:hypothetical protein GSI_11476 [Ganoderma sinense ZZ0214-1]
MSRSSISLVSWKTEDPPQRYLLDTYVNHAQEQEVFIWKHKGYMQSKGSRGVHIQAFLPDHGLWRDLDNIPDGILRISPFATTLIVRYDDISFCDAFSEALSKAERPYNKHGVEWPTETPRSEIAVYGAGT